MNLYGDVAKDVKDCLIGGCIVINLFRHVLSVLVNLVDRCVVMCLKCVKIVFWFEKCTQRDSRAGNPG